MRISKPWNEFKSAISTASESDTYEILLSAGLKRARELANMNDSSDIDTKLAERIVNDAKHRTNDPSQQLKKIKRWNKEDIMTSS